MIELHLRGRVVPGRRADLVAFLREETHDRDQARVDGDPEMREYLRRWRTLLAEPPHVETYRADPGVGAPTTDQG